MKVRCQDPPSPRRVRDARKPWQAARTAYLSVARLCDIDVIERRNAERAQTKETCGGNANSLTQDEVREKWGRRHGAVKRFGDHLLCDSSKGVCRTWR